ncbi:MAG: hypothetical protein QOI63_1245 [Thermoplasmata archaeon]|jgi:hypothetical protein|nr:hypothetical protein [Thermoplasmata archaeon]
MPRPRLAAALLALALLPAACASGPVLGARVLAAGASTVEGPLLAWVVHSGPGAQFRLEAGSFTITESWTYAPNVTRSIPMVGPTDDPRTSSHPHADGNAWMGDSKMILRPLNEGSAVVSFQAGEVALEPVGPACIKSPMPLRPVPAECTSVADGGRPVAKEAFDIQVAGSFRMEVWGWNGTITTPGLVDSFWSGLVRTGLPGVPVGVDEYQIVYVTVTDARMAFHFDALASPPILASVRVRTDDPVTLQNTVGTDLLRLPGPLDTLVRFPGGSAALTPPPPGALDLQGGGVALAGGIAAVAGVLALLALAAYGAWRLVRPSDPVLRALHRQDPVKAARLAAAAPPPRSPAEVAVRAVAFLQAGQHGQAEQLLAAYALPAADHKFILACLRARQGRSDEARLLLQEAVALNAAYADEARLNADLLPLVPGLPARPAAHLPDRPEGYA